MKVGDRVYCIKENNGHSIGTYVVLELDSSQAILSVDNGSKTGTGSFSGLDVVSRSYYLNSPIGKYSYFSDHFIDIRKYRKLKLEKINEKVYSEG